MHPFDSSSPPDLCGSLLVAHPVLRDPNFSRTIVLISAHSPTDGALGVITNRPLDKKLGDLKEEFQGTVIGDVPVYLGGPVATHEVLLAAWNWDMLEGTFRLHFGISAETLGDLVRDEPSMQARAFLGYSGWGEGQVEGELAENAWVVAPLVRAYLEGESGTLWRKVLRSEKPDLGFLADAPEDPTLN